MSRITVKFNALIESILRVPPIFILDEIFKSGFNFSFFIWNTDNNYSDSNYCSNCTIIQNNGSFVGEHFLYSSVLLTIFKFILSCTGCISALLIAMLNIRKLIIVYFYLISISMLHFSYQQNIKFLSFAINTESKIKNSTEDDSYYSEIYYSFGLSFIRTVIVQCIIGFLYQYLNPTVLKRRWLSKTVLLSFLLPTILSLFPLPSWLLIYIPFYSMLLPIAISKYIFCSNIPTISQYIIHGWRSFRNNIVRFGVFNVLSDEWSKLNIPVVLRIFWIVRLLDHTATYILQHDLFKNIILTSLPTLMELIKSLLVSGCETLIAVLGMTCVTSYICRQIGYFFQYILLIEDEEKNFGTVSGVLFCILALQTGLTGLEPEKRFVRLCRNFCLLIVALLHITHGVINPLLMSLSASHNPSLHRHVRALIVSLFLILYPSWLLIYLWRNDSISTWLFAVSIFSAEVIVKMIVSLIIYFLFLLDSYRETFWEQLDDYVYYIRSFGNSVEFCFGIFLFFNGAWILFYESGSVIRAAMMCIHAYFNIWCEAKSGWSVFIKRRTAVKKINTLPDASNDELKNLHDVCSICYQQMRTAKITTCKHYFHAVCLRKWLYLQDYCPICHNILYNQEETKEKRNNMAVLSNSPRA